MSKNIKYIFVLTTYAPLVLESYSESVEKYFKFGIVTSYDFVRLRLLNISRSSFTRTYLSSGDESFFLVNEHVYS